MTMAQNLAEFVVSRTYRDLSRGAVDAVVTYRR